MKVIHQKAFYNTILSQTISSCRKYLFVGNNFGDVFVISLENLATSNEEDYSNYSINKSRSIEPIQIFNTGNNPVNSLAFNRNFVIAGTVGCITGYIWDETKCQITRKAWEIQIPSALETVDIPDINCMLIDKDDIEHIYAGCGDSNIYAFNLEDGKLMRNFKGHKDYIHCLTKYEDNLYSASEDGSILFWDIREQKSTDIIEPYKLDKLVRPEFGKWQGSVSVTNNWLLCGGGPKPSMWHRRSKECTEVLSYPGKVHCTDFLDDMIIVAGEYSFTHQYSFNGDKIGEIPISGAAVFSIIWQNEPYKFISFAGSSNYLDICTNYHYRDAVIKLYKVDNTCPN